MRRDRSAHLWPGRASVSIRKYDYIASTHSCERIKCRLLLAALYRSRTLQVPLTGSLRK